MYFFVYGEKRRSGGGQTRSDLILFFIHSAIIFRRTFILSDFLIAVDFKAEIPISSSIALVKAVPEFVSRCLSHKVIGYTRFE